LTFFCFLLLSCNSGSSSQDAAAALGENNLSENQKKLSNDSSSQDNTTAYGIDISKFQGNEIDFLNLKKDSLTFVICKATEGITYTDPEFANNWKTIPEKGFVRGAYHFFRSQDAPASQAKNFCNAIKGIQAKDIAPIVDFEGSGIDKTQSVESVQSALLHLLMDIENTLNRKPILYTNHPIGNKYLTAQKFSSYALWIANYDVQKPNVPKSWKTEGWEFWQKSSDYKIGNTTNDFDVFNGSISDLKNFIKNY